MQFAALQRDFSSVRGARVGGGRIGQRVTIRSEDLAAQALAGKPAAWNGLIQRYNRRVIVSLLARGVPLDLALDLAQEAWARLFQQQADGKLTRLELPGLAIAQARFLALTHTRQSSKSIFDDAAVRSEFDSVVSPSVEETVLHQEQILRVQRALADCAPSARRVFLLVYENPGMPHPTAAEITGLSVQRVRQILCEVRKKLRAAAEGER